MHFRFSSALQQLLLLQLAGLSSSAITPDDAAKLAWKSYGDVIKGLLLLGVSPTPNVDYVFVTPPTTVGIRGGTPCPDAVTNWDLMGVADSLQSVDSSIFVTSGPSYIQRLQAYLLSVSLPTTVPTSAQLTKLNSLKATLTTCLNTEQSELAKAMALYAADPSSSACKQPFDTWVTTKAPAYTLAQTETAEARSRYMSFFRELYGSTSDLQSMLDNISQKAKYEKALLDGYNMPVYTRDYKVNISPWKKNDVTTDLVWSPLYTISGYEAAVDAWLQAPANAPNTSITLSMKNLTTRAQTDWSGMPHLKRALEKRDESYSLISMMSASNVLKEFPGWTESFMQDLSITLTVAGVPLAFNIKAGMWDVANPMTLYPTLLPNTPNPLANLIRTTKILAAYKPSLKMTVTTKASFTVLKTFIETAKAAPGSSLTMMGFKFGNLTGPVRTTGPILASMGGGVTTQPITTGPIDARQVLSGGATNPGQLINNPGQVVSNPSPTQLASNVVAVDPNVLTTVIDPNLKVNLTLGGIGGLVRPISTIQIVEQTWGGEVIIPPAPDGMVFLLGALGRRVGT